MAQEDFSRTMPRSKAASTIGRRVRRIGARGRICALSTELLRATIDRRSRRPIHARLSGFKRGIVFCAGIQAT